MAIAPPFGFTRGSSSAIPSSRRQASDWAANASFSSRRSIWSSDRPARASTLLVAGTGPIPMIRGSTPAAALATTRARGARPISRAPRSEASRSAAAPSLRPDEFPAVTEPAPSERKAGLSRASASRVVSGRRNSSSSTRRGSPFFCAISTAAISAANRPAARAAAAFCCDRSANASWSSRLMPYCSATFSAVSPMECVPKAAFILGLTNRQPRLVSKS